MLKAGVLVSLAIGLLGFAPLQAPQTNAAGAGADTYRSDLNKQLFAAIQARNNAKVKDLLHNGANPNALDENGNRALINALFYSYNEDAARLLIQQGADVNCQDRRNNGITPLICSLGDGSTDLLDLILSRGADPNTPMKDGRTALHCAVAYGNIEAVAKLLKAGANVHARTVLFTGDPSDGDTLALFMHPEQDKHYMEDIYPRLFEPGFIDSGKTPLMQPLVWKSGIAQLLLKSGANLNETDDNGWTALHHAVHGFDAKEAEGLLALGANVNARSNFGNTPLHLAVHCFYNHNSSEEVQLLLAHGADRTLKNKAGRTPLEELRNYSEFFLQEGQHNPQLVVMEHKEGFLATANRIAKLIDPHAAPITTPEPEMSGGARVLYPLDIVDGKVQRLIKRGVDRTTLILEFPKQNSQFKRLNITEIELDYYDPLVKTPISFDLKKGGILKVPFPRAAGDYGAIIFRYSFDNDFSGTNEYNEADAEAQFDTGPDNGIYMESVIPNRVEEVRLSRVARNGKGLEKLAGKTFRISQSQRFKLPGLTWPQMGESVSIYIAYSYRVLPNTKWRKAKDMDLGR